jgi:hypothetical protein
MEITIIKVLLQSTTRKSGNLFRNASRLYIFFSVIDNLFCENYQITT